MLVEIEARIARGEAGIPERRQTWPTVGELFARFLGEYSRPKLKDPDRYRYVARSILKKAAPLTKLKTAEIKTTDILRLRDALLRRHAPGTVGNVLRQLGRVFSWGMTLELCPHNPCKGVERPTAASTPDFLSKEEVCRLLEAAEKRIGTTPMAHKLYVAIAIAVHTGLRKGELLGLRWTDLDLQTRRLTVARSYRGTPKSGKARHLRLPKELLPVLMAWRPLCPPSPDNAVVPSGLSASRVGGPECMLGVRELMAAIGLRRFAHPFHILRHTYASHFVMAGGNLLALQRILGHKDPKVTMIYAHLAPDFLGDQMDLVSFGGRKQGRLPA
jgi:integrase